MPQPYDYLGLMGGAANIGGVVPSIQQTLLGQQNIQQNNNVLAQQQRAEQARRALAVATDPNAAPEMRDQAMNALQQSDPAQASALRTQMQQRQQIAAYNANPSARATLELFTTQPELKDALEKGWEFYSGASRQAKLNALADAKGYLDKGDPSGALRIAREHMEADKAAGLDINGYQQIIDAIQSGNGLAIVNPMLAAGAGPEKFAEAYGKIGEEERADEVQPYKVAQEQATASIKGTEAKYAPEKAQSELDTAVAQRQRMAVQNATDRINAAVAQGRLGLDTDRFAADIELRMAELEQKGGALTPASEKLVNDAAGEAAEKQQLAEREKALADRIRASGMGVYGSAREKVKAIWGGQDGYTQLRNEYLQMRNSGALANRANMPGAMSDADREFLLQGFPSINANAPYIARFLETMSKAHEGAAKQADAKAVWAATNGSLGPAKRAFAIDGFRIPQGMTFAQQQAAMAKINADPVPADAAAVAERARGR